MPFPELARMRRWLMVGVALGACPIALQAQRTDVRSVQGDSIAVRLIDVDLRTAAQSLGQYLDHPLIIGAVASGARVTLDSPRPIAHHSVLSLLRGLLDGQGVAIVLDSTAGIYRLTTKEAVRSALYPAPLPPTRQAGQELFVLRLKHARAADAAAMVNSLYGKPSAPGEIGDRMGPTLSRDLQAGSVAPGAIAAVVPGGGGGPRAGGLMGDITIVPDARANALLVRASRNDFQLIEAAVQQIDVRPLQVLVEVLIAEVRKDRLLDFGIDVTLPPTSVRNNPSATADGKLVSGGIGDFVLHVMGMGGANIEANIRAAAARGDATIVSRPVLLAANNEKAEINVGSQRPFVQVSRVLPTDNAARDQVIQYKDVGTRLSVLPTISADGYVMLQLVQEVNAATAEQQFQAPVISTRSVETRALIRTGHTIVLGGLSDRQNEHTQSGVPFLSALPWIGGLFGRLNDHASQTELLLFVTPKIIQDDDMSDSLSTELRERANRMTHQ